MTDKVAQPKRRGRPPTGNVQPWRDAEGRLRYRARIRLSDGSVRSLDIPERTSHKEARALAMKWQQQELATSALYHRKLEELGKPVGGETTGTWFARYTKARLENGVLEANRNRKRWQRHIGSFLDRIPIVELEKRHIVQVRDHLDKLARTGELHPKSCLNIWSVLTKAMREAVSSKLPGMQVRATNPCSEVQAPDRGESRTRPWLTPKEVYQLLACTSVPLARRQLYAVAAYTYCRPGELAGATFADIDLGLGVIYVRRALNWDTRETKRPKTRSGRRIVPIHPNLAPLLQAMRQDERTPLWPDLSQWNSDRGGMTFREDLRTAGVQREELYTGNEETTPADLRSLRTTGATLAAISGIQGKTLERRIGHGGGATVDRYVGIAEDITKGAIGEPFGPLPASLIRETIEGFSVIVSVTKNEEPRFQPWIPGVSRSGEGGIRTHGRVSPTHP
jgi:integrase